MNINKSWGNMNSIDTLGKGIHLFFHILHMRFHFMNSTTCSKEFLVIFIYKILELCIETLYLCFRKTNGKESLNQRILLTKVNLLVQHEIYFQWLTVVLSSRFEGNLHEDHRQDRRYLFYLVERWLPCLEGRFHKSFETRNADETAVPLKKWMAQHKFSWLVNVSIYKQIYIIHILKKKKNWITVRQEIIGTK